MPLRRSGVGAGTDRGYHAADRYGTFLFNTLVSPPRFLRPRAASEVDVDDETRALLAHEALDETAVLPADLGQSGYDVVPPHSAHPHGQQQPARTRTD